MLSISKKYNLCPNIINHIISFLPDYKKEFNKVIKQINSGFHFASIIEEKDKNFAVDFYSIMLTKKLFTIKLTRTYIYTKPPFLELGISSSSPIFYCKICGRYHKQFGKKMCTKYGLNIV